MAEIANGDETTQQKSPKSDAELAGHGYDPFRSSVAQICTILVQNLTMLGFGMSLAIPTVVIGSLLQKSGDNGDSITLTETEASWYGSVVLVCHPTGGLLSGVLQELIGRKWCMALVSLPQLIGWYVLWKARNPFDLYVSCVALGLSMGLSEAPILTYVGEAVEPRLRGPLSSVSTFTFMLGSFIAYFVSTALPWRMVAMINMSAPVVSFVAIMFFTPESPVWLLSKNRSAEAKKSLAYLRGCVTTDDVEDEFAELSNYTRCDKTVDLEQNADCGTDQRRLSYVKYLQINANDTTNTASETIANRKWTGFLENRKNFWTPELLRPFLFIILFFFFWNFATFIPAQPYLMFVFVEIGLPSSAEWTLVYTSVLTMTGTLINVMTVSKFGKRPITLTSMVLCAFSMLGIGMYVLTGKYFSFSCTWIPMILLHSMYFFSGYGVVPIPWMLISEIYPTKGRGIVSGLTAALAFLMTFVLTKSFFEMVKLITLPGLFIFYGTITLVGTLYLYARMPETENKTLQEIEQFFVCNLEGSNGRESIN